MEALGWSSKRRRYRQLGCFSSTPPSRCLLARFLMGIALLNIVLFVALILLFLLQTITPFNEPVNNVYR